jgi:hypothetical protein
MLTIDIEKFRATQLRKKPYEYLIVPGFIKDRAIGTINKDYPKISEPGSFPLSGLQTGPSFRTFVEEMSSKELRSAFSEKFRLDLEGRPLTVTVRGMSQSKDGQIHTDSKSKIITILIYMNTEWSTAGGRLRILRASSSIDDYAAEVPPTAGTLLAFRRSVKSWHGHKPFKGERKVIQFNWVTNRGVLRREVIRHRISAFVKSFKSPRAAALEESR